MKAINKENKIYTILQNRKIWIFISVVIISIVNLYDLPSLYSITIINDEFGYVGMAAQMAGYDWKELLSTSQYYSYGYGIILAVLFKIGFTGSAFFRATVVLNTFFLIASFGITYYLTRKILHSRADILIALAINLYSCNILQSRIAWVETILYFGTWLFIYFVYRLSNKYELKHILGIVLVSVCMYTIHQRCLSIIFVAIVMVTIILINDNQRKNNICKTVLIGIMMVGLLFEQSKYKQFIIQNWYVGGGYGFKNCR